MMRPETRHSDWRVIQHLKAVGSGWELIHLTLDKSHMKRIQQLDTNQVLFWAVQQYRFNIHRLVILQLKSLFSLTLK